MGYQEKRLKEMALSLITKRRCGWDVHTIPQVIVPGIDHVTWDLLFK